MVKTQKRNPVANEALVKKAQVSLQTVDDRVMEVAQVSHKMEKEKMAKVYSVAVEEWVVKTHPNKDRQCPMGNVLEEA